MTAAPIATFHPTTYGRNARNRRAAALTPEAESARAALETFYFAFNHKDLAVHDAVWAPDALVQLNNPLGGVLRGVEPIRELYRGVFEGPADVWVELHDIVEYLTQEAAIFAGRERGAFTRDGVTVPLAIRTTRVFRYLGPELGWRQIHHHGSIDDPSLLERYQRAVRGGETAAR